jgi:ceramide glucosyltransferase
MRRRVAWLAKLLVFLLMIALIACRLVPLAARVIALGIAFLCGASAVFGIAYTLLAAVLTRRFFKRSPSEPSTFPPVTIIKPLRGKERMLFENLSSFCEQNYPGPMQFLFGVQDLADPALEIVDRLRLLYPNAHVTVVADSRLYGPNRKMSNIINMLPQAQHDVLVFADSDVGVGPDYLRHVVGELQKPHVGLVTCLYRGQPDPGFWPRLSVMATNYQFIPGAVTGLKLKLARPCFGQTIAVRRATLDKIGGFSQFVHHLAEDHAIGEAVRQAGESVSVPPFVVTHACVETSAADLIAHELRWSRTIRTIDPGGHLGSALMHPLAFAIIGIIASGGSAWSWSLMLAALLARLALKLQFDYAVDQPVRDLWLFPIWDLGSFGIFVMSFFSRHVIWRGVRFNVGGNGLLYPIQED